MVERMSDERLADAAFPVVPDKEMKVTLAVLDVVASGQKSLSAGGAKSTADLIKRLATERDQYRQAMETYSAAMTNAAAGQVEAERRLATAREALEQSVKFQSHYAAILNDYDGGKRMVFANADAWLKRLASQDIDLIATYRNHHAQLVAGLAALGEVERLRGALQYLRTQAKNGTLHPQVVIQNADMVLGQDA